MHPTRKKNEALINDLEEVKKDYSSYISHLESMKCDRTCVDSTNSKNLIPKIGEQCSFNQSCGLITGVGSKTRWCKVYTNKVGLSERLENALKGVKEETKKCRPKYVNMHGLNEMTVKNWHDVLDGKLEKYGDVKGIEVKENNKYLNLNFDTEKKKVGISYNCKPDGGENICHKILHHCDEKETMTSTFTVTFEKSAKKVELEVAVKADGGSGKVTYTISSSNGGERRRRLLQSHGNGSS